MQRIYHTWDKWECYPAGFYDNNPPKGIKPKDAVDEYKIFLADIPRFSSALQRVITEWPTSCEHYLTNENMNRIAWLGQAAMCIDSGVPSSFRAGYNLLTEEQKALADGAALVALNQWLVARGEPALDQESVKPKTEANLY